MGDRSEDDRLEVGGPEVDGPEVDGSDVDGVKNGGPKIVRPDSGEDAARDAYRVRNYTGLQDAEITAFSHLYRGEVYRSTLWRTRLDTTTNWAVVTLGVALSITFATPQASPLPLLLVGILIIFFLMLEARRYRYFNVWRARCRWMETHFFVPMLDREAVDVDTDWQKILAQDYLHPIYHVPLRVAIGRRIRRNYFWVLLIQTVAYAGKLMVHPEPLTSVNDLFVRATIGPVHGGWILAIGTVYLSSWAIIALMSRRGDKRRAEKRGNGSSGMG